MTVACAGIDVSKRKPDSHVNGKDKTVENGPAGFRALAERLSAMGAGRVVIEAAGRFHRSLPQSLHARGFAVCAVNPRQSRRFAGTPGQLAKPGRADARIPAAFGAAFPDMRVTEPRGELPGRLCDFLVLRAKTVEQRAALKRACAETGDEAAEAADGVLDSRTAAIAEFDKRIKALTESDPACAEKCRILQSVPGIGPITAAALICQLSELGTLSGRQAAALAGVAPMARGSGQSSGARHVRGGRRRACVVQTVVPNDQHFKKMRFGA